MATYNFLDKTGLGLVWAKIKALIPSKTSDLQNDSGFITDVQDSDGNTLVSNGVAELPEYLDAPTVYVYEWDINNDSNTVYFYKDHYCEEHYTFRELNADIMKKPSLLIGFFDGEDRRYHLYAQSYASWLWSLKQLDGYSSFSNSIWTNVINKSGDHWDDNAYAVYNETGNAIDYDDLVNKPTIPTVEQSDWSEDDSTDDAYILNRPAIRAGEGTNSIIEGQIEQDEDAVLYELTITGDARATTYTYTTQDTLPTSVTYLAIQCGTNYSKVVSINTSSNTIGVDKTLSTVALINSEALLYSKYKKATGEQAHAEGKWTFAVGTQSHAEGSHTYAMGNRSHTEGANNTASGAASHVEGQQNIASGSASHAEGLGVKATNTYAHAEGTFTEASGNSAHAEGRSTIASGTQAHAEGIGTRASSDYQHTQGKYNIEDANGVYADIVGNGTADNARSNAYTLDWSGNGVYSGKLTVGAGPTNNMDVATKQYVDNAIPTVPDDLGDLTDIAISSPANGQVLKYNSTTSKWVNADVSVPSPSNTTPSADGTGSAGSSTNYARADHVHPKITQTISMTNNVITLSGSDGTSSTVTLPVYNGGVQTV